MLPGRPIQHHPGVSTIFSPCGRVLLAVNEHSAQIFVFRGDVYDLVDDITLGDVRPQISRSRESAALAEIRQLSGDGRGAVAGAAIIDIIERHQLA